MAPASWEASCIREPCRIVRCISHMAVGVVLDGPCGAGHRHALACIDGAIACSICIDTAVMAGCARASCRRTLPPDILNSRGLPRHWSLQWQLHFFGATSGWRSHWIPALLVLAGTDITISVYVLECVPVQRSRNVLRQQILPVTVNCRRHCSVSFVIVINRRAHDSML